MKGPLYISIVAFTALSCGTPSQDKAPHPDTLAAGETSTVNPADRFIAPDLTTIRREYIASYKDEIRLDTLISLNAGNKARVQSRYFCLFDSAIHVPGRYNLDDTTQVFITHNFVHRIRITIGKEVIFDRTIRKSDFADSLFPELLEYAVLCHPNFDFDESRQLFQFQYSVSIPVTDVGVGISTTIDQSGHWAIQPD